MIKKTNVYVDAFNLYYRALKRTPYKWLNLGKLCNEFFPNLSINEIKVFTAKTKFDNDKRFRQEIYFRALRTLPNLSFIWGNFQKQEKKMPLITKNIKGEENKIYVSYLGKPIELPICDKFSQNCWVEKIEEKGSDVNLAIHLLKDAFEKKFDSAIVISNDADLKNVIKIVNQEIKLPVFVLNPQKELDKNSKTPKLWKGCFSRIATKIKILHPERLKNCLFPDILQDINGSFKKPESW